MQEIWNRIQIESEESTLGSGFFRLQSKIRFLKILIKGMHNPVLDLGIRIWIVQMERTLNKANQYCHGPAYIDWIRDSLILGSGAGLCVRRPGRAYGSVEIVQLV